MNRQQRRKQEREKQKQQSQWADTINNPVKRKQTEPIVRQSFSEGQIYNNHEWAVRLERLVDVKGIGPKTLKLIFEALEDSLTTAEKEKAKARYTKGMGE